MKLQLSNFIDFVFNDEIMLYKLHTSNKYIKFMYNLYLSQYRCKLTYFNM